MAPRCQVDKEWQTTRKDLLKFTADAKNIKSARDNTPYHRTVAHDQVELIESLRKNYSKYGKHYQPDKVIRVRRHQICSFDLKSSNTIHLPTFVHGIYNKDSGVVVDFANKNLGGGFLTYGLAQEEVMFLERLDIGFYVAMMYAMKKPFKIEEDEAMLICGADKWVSLDFYGRVPSDWPDKSTFLPAMKPEQTGEIIAIDCLRPKFRKYEKGDLQWILKKAYVGFQSTAETSISTGNWGCGAFDNNKNTVFCIQVLAAALAGKYLYYHATQPEVETGYFLVRNWIRSKTSIRDAFEELVLKCKTDENFLTNWDPKRTTTGVFEEKEAGGRRSTKSRPSVNKRRTITKPEGLFEMYQFSHEEVDRNTYANRRSTVATDNARKSRKSQKDFQWDDLTAPSQDYTTGSSYSSIDADKMMTRHSKRSHSDGDTNPFVERRSTEYSEKRKSIRTGFSRREKESPQRVDDGVRASGKNFTFRRPNADKSRKSRVSVVVADVDDDDSQD